MSRLGAARAAGLGIALCACRGPGGAPSSPGAPAAGAAPVTAFVGVTVVPMDREVELPDRTVIVRAGRIATIGPAAGTAIPGGARIVDGHGRWLLPGLADLHVHLDIEAALPLLIASGVTTVRDLWGTPLTLLERREIAAGRRLGPTVYASGPVIDGDPPVWSGSAIVTTDGEAERAVAEQQADGYDAIKVYNDLSPESYDALIAAARRHGLPLVGHVPTRVPLSQALSRRQRSIEHLTGYLVALQSEGSPFFGTVALPHRRHLAEHVDLAKLPALVQTTRASGVWNCPTLTVDSWTVPRPALDALRARPEMRFVPPWMRASWDEVAGGEPLPPVEYEKNHRAAVVLGGIVRALSDAGAGLVLGTDSPNPFVIPGVSAHDELGNLTRAGLSPYQALRAATADAARFLGAEHELGTIAVGLRADLVLVDGDPLADVGNARRIAGVMVRGRYLPSAELAALLDGLAATWEAAPTGARWAGAGELPEPAAGAVREWTARYAIERNGIQVGEERLAVDRLVDGGRAIHAEAMTDPPDRSHYRSSLTTLADGEGALGAALQIKSERPEGSSRLAVSRRNGRLLLRGEVPPARRIDLDLPLAPGALLAGPTLADELLLVEKLANIPPGGARSFALESIELDAGSGLDFAAAPTSCHAERLPGPAPRFRLVFRTGRAHRAVELQLDAAGHPERLTTRERGGRVEYRLLPGG